MRAILSIIAIFIVGSCNVDTSSKVSTTDAGKDTSVQKSTTPDSSIMLIDSIAKIDSLTKAIESTANKLKTVKKDILGKSTEGGELTKFYTDKKIVMVTIRYYGEMGQNLTTYFPVDGNVIKIKSQEDHYDKPMYIEGSKVDSSDVSFFYFTNARWIVMNKQRKISSDSLHQQKVADLLSDYKEEMKSK